MSVGGRVMLQGCRVRHPFFGDGLVVGLRDQDILDINFGGTQRSIKAGVVAMERV